MRGKGRGARDEDRGVKARADGEGGGRAGGRAGGGAGAGVRAKVER